MRSLKLGHQARANTDKGQEGSALARTIAVVAVIAGAVLVVLTLFGNGDGYRYKMLFQTGGQLVPGNQVMVAGQPVGTIDSIELTDDAQAEVDVKLDRPLLEGTTAQIRLTSLSGIANRYIALHMGPDPDAELPDGATLAADDTTSPVDLDQLFNTFDERTRASLQDFIQGQATVYTGNSAAARRTYKYFAPSLQAGERLLSDLNYDQQALTRFLVEGGRVFGAVAERRDDLAALTQNANEALGAVAAENDVVRPGAQRPAAGDAPGEHDVREPARRPGRPRPADRRPRRRGAGPPAVPARRAPGGAQRDPAAPQPAARDPPQRRQERPDRRAARPAGGAAQGEQRGAAARSPRSTTRSTSSSSSGPTRRT